MYEKEYPLKYSNHIDLTYDVLNLKAIHANITQKHENL